MFLPRPLGGSKKIDPLRVPKTDPVVVEGSILGLYFLDPFKGVVSTVRLQGLRSLVTCRSAQVPPRLQWPGEGGPDPRQGKQDGGIVALNPKP